MFKLQNRLRIFLLRPPKGVRAKSVILMREDGSKLRLRILQPLETRTKSGPAVLWMHGGGYATGTPEISGEMCKKLILEGASVVVAPDYRLSLDAPYPAALLDCYKALLWLKDNAKSLNANSDQIMVGGESAGGGLTVAICLFAREKGEVNLAFQMPIYPMLDDRPTKTSRFNNDVPGWNSHNNTVAWRLYLGKLSGVSDVPCFAAPARATDLKGLPPATTFIGDLDIFLAETTDFFSRLQKTGVAANCRVYKGCYHGFDLVCPNAEISKKATEEFLQDFRFAKENYFTKQPKQAQDD